MKQLSFAVAKLNGLLFKYGDFYHYTDLTLAVACFRFLPPKK
jgi:hypothetical protein